ncbi:hypothetical protein EI94DRAFT_1740394, partial [Lactarius quietus]
MQLVAERATRFKSLGQKEDLDIWITHLTEALLFHSLFPHAPCFRLTRYWVVTMLFWLAQSLSLRYTVFRSPGDVESSVKYVRYIRDNFYPLEAFQLERDEFISTFVEVLAHYVMLKTGDDESEYMKEMVDILRKFGTSDFSKGRLSIAISSLSEAIINIYFRPDSKQPPEQVIEVLREAMTQNPDKEQVVLALAVCLVNRFSMTQVMDDYEEAISIVDKFLASHPIGDFLTPTQEIAVTLVLWLLEARMTRSPKPEYLENAISRLRALLCVPSLSGPLRYHITGSLDRHVQQRSEYFGVTGSSAAEISPDNSGVIPGSLSSPILATSQPTIETANEFMEHGEKKKILTELLTAIHNDDNTDVEGIVERGRMLLSVTPLAHTSYRTWKKSCSYTPWSWTMDFCRPFSGSSFHAAGRPQHGLVHTPPRQLRMRNPCHCCKRLLSFPRLYKLSTFDS